MSYSRPEEHDQRQPKTSEYAPPGQYKWEYDEHKERDRYGSPTSPREDRTRHLSLSTAANIHVDIGRDHQSNPAYGQPISPWQERPQYPPIQPIPAPRPDTQRAHSDSISSGRHDYASPDRYQYADPSQHIKYVSKTDERRPSYTQSAHPQFAEIKPKPAPLHAPPSPGLGARMHRLSVSGAAPGALSLAAPSLGHGHVEHGKPPGSPLLEAYHGTYQSISPMASPMMLPSRVDSDLSDFEPLSHKHTHSSDDSSLDHRRKKAAAKKRVSFYSAEPDALTLAKALNHHHPELGPVVDILPPLTHDHILELRTEYKKHIKVNGKGINIAKHIKLKIPGNLGKVAYAVALGRWESEAHWANFWYQSNSSRRELLIESLMGRTNSDIKKIKDAFSDKRYNDSLDKCMETELKKDKFRLAVLLALEERRMEENVPPMPELVQRDVRDLYRALTSKEGGETAMINIIVVRSDNHLRDVLRDFEKSYRKNFAREMIQKSRNLVVSFPPFLILNIQLTHFTQGETLAHILNGVLNRPVRDTLLLHQALGETSKDRTELLISRLVRFHWEPMHLERVKLEYKKKYGSRLEKDIEEGTKGEFAQFCVGLCGPPK